MRHGGTPSIFAFLTGAVLLTALASPTVAQDDPGPPAERSADWYAWSQKFAQNLERMKRPNDAIEEHMVSGRFNPDEREPWARAALLAVLEADNPRQPFTPESPFYKLASASVMQAVRRTTAEELKAGKSDPRVNYAIGRLRFVDALQPGNGGRMGELMSICLRAFRGAISNAESEGFNPEIVKPWYFRSAVNLAQALTHDGRLADARLVLDEAFERFGDHVALTSLDRRFGQIARAELFRALDERERAEETYLEVIREYPESARAHLGLARVLFDQSKLADALTHLEQGAAFAQRQPNQEATLVEALITSVSICLKLDPPQLERAEKLLDRYQLLRKDHPDGLYMRGQIAVERGQWTDARNLFRRVNRQLPDDRPTLVGLAQALGALGEVTEVDAITKRIREIDAAEAAKKSKKNKPSAPLPDDAEKGSDAEKSAPESADPGKDPPDQSAK